MFNIEQAINNAKKDINEILNDLSVTVAIAQGKPVKISATDKHRIIEKYKAGADTEEVARSFPNYTINQLGAIRAHVTMNTY